MKDVHIISNKGKWGIYKLGNIINGKYRSVRNFKHRDLAFHHACMRFKTKIIVHNTDGGVDFIEHNLN